MRRHRLAPAALLLVVAAALAASAWARPDQTPPPSTAALDPASPLAPLRGVNFTSVCRFSHRAPDDPIVFPGEPGRSHDHTFVGNRTTSAWSTLETLLAGATTCIRPGDTAAYWMPTLLSAGQAAWPIAATVYYRRRTLSPVQPFPAGLRMIAGDAKATSPQELRVTRWTCGPAAAIAPSSSPPVCPDVLGSGLRLQVTFPGCWDGVSLDSPDHKSHMAYARGGRCPRTHPVALPEIEVIFRYRVLNGADVVLASGGQLSGHADFVNAWNQDALRSLVDGCLNALRHCVMGS